MQYQRNCSGTSLRKSRSKTVSARITLMHYILFFICGLALMGCTSYADRENILAANNFDGLEGWAEPHASITSERSHSGKYSMKVDAGTEYSLSFNQLLGKITNRKPRKIKVELWTYIPGSHARARFVVNISDPQTNESRFSQDFNLIDKTSDYRRWVRIAKILELPETIKLSDKMSCFLWRPEQTNEAVFIDDLLITILD